MFYFCIQSGLTPTLLTPVSHILVLFCPLKNLFCPQPQLLGTVHQSLSVSLSWFVNGCFGVIYIWFTQVLYPVLDCFFFFVFYSLIHLCSWRNSESLSSKTFMPIIYTSLTLSTLILQCLVFNTYLLVPMCNTSYSVSHSLA